MLFENTEVFNFEGAIRGMSDEQKKKYFQKLSESLQGHIIPEETRLKISKSNKGISRNKGVIRSEETKLKISNSKRGKN